MHRLTRGSAVNEIILIKCRSVASTVRVDDVEELPVINRAAEASLRKSTKQKAVLS